MDDSVGGGAVSWVGGLPVPFAGAPGLRIECALLGDDDSRVGPPWREWSPGGTFARVLVARTVFEGCSADGALAEPMALKLERDEFGGVAAGDPFGAGWTNASVDDMWRREMATHGGAAGAVMARCLLSTASGRVAPTTYCRERRVFFSTFCAETTTPLTTCRDDELLKRAGLEPYSSTLLRYATPAGSSGERFYTWSRDSGTEAATGVTVRRRHELYRDWRELWQRDLADADRDRLERDFPCWTCEHRGECYAPTGAGDEVVAESRLVPFNFYDAHALLLQAHEVGFDELAALLGGAVAEAKRPAVLNQDAAWLTPGTAPSAGRGGRWVTEQLARESAWLKASTCLALCRAVETFHRATGRAHLDVSPRHVRTHLASRHGHAVPTRWSGDLALLDACAHQVVEPGTAAVGVGVPPLLVPTASADEMHRSPMVDPGGFRTVTQGALRLTLAADGGLELELSAASARFEHVCAGDVAHVAPDGDLPGHGDTPLLGVVREVRPGHLRIAVALPDDAGLQAEALPLEVAARVTTHQVYGPSCDLYGLGMMAGRLFLVNDQSDTFAVDDILRGARERFEHAVRGSSGNPMSAARRILATCDLHPESVLYDTIARQELAEPPFSVELWLDLWCFVLRLMTHTPGFSFASHHGEPAVMEQVCREFEGLAARFRIAAFGRTVRDAELGEITSAALDQVRQLLVQEDS